MQQDLALLNCDDISCQMIKCLAILVHNRIRAASSVMECEIIVEDVPAAFRIVAFRIPGGNNKWLQSDRQDQNNV